MYTNQFYLGWNGHDIRLLFRQIIVTQAYAAPGAGKLGEWSEQERSCSPKIEPA